MKPYYESGPVTLYHGASEVVMKSFADSSIDAIVTDPPYELGFMGKKWDSSGIAYSVELWAEALRVLKPGGHLLAFGGSRTYHRMAVAIEDSGFELRPSIAWLYGSGFPKSLDVSKAIDKAAGAVRQKVSSNGGLQRHANLNDDGWSKVGAVAPEMDGPDPVTANAKAWQGWGTALKPAFEPVVVARKPLAGTVAANVLTFGTGALNIERCRIGTTGGRTVHTRSAGTDRGQWSGNKPTGEVTDNGGRWPTNVVLDESQAEVLDAQSGRTVSRSGGTSTKAFGLLNDDAWVAREVPRGGHDDEGGASRFFPTFKYEAKAPSSERPVVDGVAHATVKPLALMRWLVRLVTPPGGVVLDPFAGSGTTLEAAVLEGFETIGIELGEEHLPLIRHRFAKPLAQGFDLGDIA